MVTTQRYTEQELSVPLIGRDELNLAEFPIALLADRASNGQKTLYFEDQHGRLTVTGSDAYGLPTAADNDVIVSLLYLTKQRNNFTDVKVNFSRYEVIKMLNWPDDGGFYKRLDQSFNRWTGVMMVYDKCWWDNKTKRYVSAKMHILESVVISESRGRSRTSQSSLPLSTFTWNKTFIESCQANNLRQLDLEEYFSLNSPVAKRLYRFLGKRFHVRRDWTFDLNEIAFERVGLSRSYTDAGKIKEKLQPAIDELESIGFLRPLPRDERYKRIDRGQWTIRLTRQSPTLVAPQPLAVPAAVEPPPLVAALVKRGVSDNIAVELVAAHPADAIERQIEILDWLEAKKPGKIAEPGGWLVKAIKDGHATPKGFVSTADRHKAEEVRQAKARSEAEESRKKQHAAAQEQADRTAFDAYVKQLSKAERDGLEAKALAAASEASRTVYDDPAMARFRGTLMVGMLREYLCPILREQKIAGA